MHKIEFSTELKGEDIEIIGLLSEDNETILSKKATVEWSIEPSIESWGVRYWRQMMTSFKCEVEIKPGDYNPEKVLFDDGSDDYQMELIFDDYQMKQDFMITRIEIDRKKKTAKAFIQS